MPADLGVGRADERQRRRDAPGEVRHVDLLTGQELAHLAERGRRERDVEGQQRHVHAVHPHAVDELRPGRRRDDDDVVTGQLQVAGQVVHLHLDAAEPRHVAVRHQPDLQRAVGRGRIRVGGPGVGGGRFAERHADPPLSLSLMWLARTGLARSESAAHASPWDPVTTPTRTVDPCGYEEGRRRTYGNRTNQPCAARPHRVRVRRSQPTARAPPADEPPRSTAAHSTLQTSSRSSHPPCSVSSVRRSEGARTNARSVRPIRETPRGASRAGR